MSTHIYEFYWPSISDQREIRQCLLFERAPSRRTSGEVPFATEAVIVDGEPDSVSCTSHLDVPSLPEAAC